MASVLSVCGSPSASSRTAHLLRQLDNRLAAHGHEVTSLDIRALPPQALFHADTRHPAIAAAVRYVAQTDGIVIATPIYKAAYSGALKTLLDLLPQHALAGKIVLPLATGGSNAYVLAIDYALRPVLNSMGAAHIVQGRFTLDEDITVHEDGSVTIEPPAADALNHAVDQFAHTLNQGSARACQENGSVRIGAAKKTV
ncbi:NADPH-dependent FMN reductase [Streptomyces sp. NBC_01077]|uniref:NADPH-dependent FMN reductase n=1 Tax=Streptomyces sp. NBC_01077 TaxID=2903746 RepID=UPI00386ECB21|nr:NADPH-dependent FMN reductase [Streptomyces sp. NBC_01077]WSV43640.1 NADPH-dependent FMN reductase [Streptomyces sp. NBC_01077]